MMNYVKTDNNTMRRQYHSAPQPPQKRQGKPRQPYTNPSKIQARNTPHAKAQTFNHTQQSEEIIRPRRYTAADGTRFEVIPLREKGNKIPCVIDRITSDGHIVTNYKKRYASIEAANQAALEFCKQYVAMTASKSTSASVANGGDTSTPPGLSPQPAVKTTNALPD